MVLQSLQVGPGAFVNSGIGVNVVTWSPFAALRGLCEWCQSLEIFLFFSISGPRFKHPGDRKCPRVLSRSRIQASSRQGMWWIFSFCDLRVWIHCCLWEYVHQGCWFEQFYVSNGEAFWVSGVGTWQRFLDLFFHFSLSFFLASVWILRTYRTICVNVFFPIATTQVHIPYILSLLFFKR